MGISAEIALFVDYIVSDVRITFNVGNEQVEEAWTDEELEICLKLKIRTGEYRNRPPNDVRPYLLIYVTIGWTPTECLIITASTVDGGLRVDGQKSQFIHLC